MDKVEGCAECTRLAQAYESETMAWFRLEGQLRIAEYGRDAAAAERIAKDLDGVTRRRSELRAAMERHRNEFHAGGTHKIRAVSSC